MLQSSRENVYSCGHGHDAGLNLSQTNSTATVRNIKNNSNITQTKLCDIMLHPSSSHQGWPWKMNVERTNTDITTCLFCIQTILVQYDALVVHIINHILCISLRQTIITNIFNVFLRMLWNLEEWWAPKKRKLSVFCSMLRRMGWEPTMAW